MAEVATANRRVTRLFDFRRPHGEQVSISSSVQAKPKLGLGRVTFGAEMRQRFPGLPKSRPLVLGVALKDGAIDLSLPTNAAGKRVLPAGTELLP